MLYLIGLGLGDAKDITVKGLEVVRRCSRVYLEAYTSILTVGKELLVRGQSILQMDVYRFLSIIPVTKLAIRLAVSAEVVKWLYLQR